MRFGPVPSGDCAGAILAHTIHVGNRSIRKGTVLGTSDAQALCDAGIAQVTVARLEQGDIDENTAAARLAAALAGADPAARGLRLSRAETGRVNLYAAHAGLLVLDTDRIDRLNSVDPMITLATLAPFRRVGEGAMLATIKIISYAVEGALLARAEAQAAGALQLCRPRIEHVTLIETVIQGAVPSDKGRRAIDARLRALGIARPADYVQVPHEATALAAALKGAQGQALLILTASATSDAHDTAPEAVRSAGGQVERFGMPVDPGNLLFVGRLGTRPVIGLPGCARSVALNGADWVMDRVLCGQPVSAADISAMGVGGLLKEIPSRPRPRARNAVPPA